MKLAILCLVPISFLISWIITRFMRAVSPLFGFVDRPGTRKIHDKPMPLGGGVGIFSGVFIPLLFTIAWILLFDAPLSWADLLHVSPETIDAYWSGARQQIPVALCVFVAGGMMFVLGLRDDMAAMGPMIKLFLQLAIITALVIAGNLRVLTVLGVVPSTIVSVLWIVTIVNAFNFLDNMDGLSAGVGAVCTVAFLVATVSIGQWFVAAGLALLLGSLLGFLWHNFPPARIFMGDAGSLTIGLLLGVLTVRTTYLPDGMQWQNRWYAVFAPMIVLALPLYDLALVVFIRLAQRRSPFVGDKSHFSHRLVDRGMSRRAAVLFLYLVAAATSISAIILPHVSGDMAILIVAQTLLMLGVVALLEKN